MHIRCPSCDIEFSVQEGDPQREVKCPGCKVELGCVGDKSSVIEEPLEIIKLATLVGHKEQVHSVAFSPDGKLLASGSTDHILRLWDVTEMRSLARFDFYPGDARCLAFSPDGRTLVTGDGTGAVRLWDVAAKRQIGLFRWHVAPLSAVAFSQDGRYLATASSDRASKIYTKRDKAIELDSTGRVIVWDLLAHREVNHLRMDACNDVLIALSPDGRTLVVYTWSMRLLFIDFASGQRRRADFDTRFAATSVVFSPSGDRVITAHMDGRLRLWDPSSGTLRRTINALGRNQYFMPPSLRSAAISPDGKLLAAGEESSGSIQLVDMATGRGRARIEAPGPRAYCVAFSPSGGLLAAGGALANSGVGVAVLWKLPV